MFKLMLLESNPVKSHGKKIYKTTWKGPTFSFHVLLLAAGITDLLYHPYCTKISISLMSVLQADDKII